MKLKEYCTCCIEILDWYTRYRPDAWAEMFIRFRMKLSSRFGKGLILSTSHGIEIFQNILTYLPDPDSYPLKELSKYEENFVTLLKRNQ